MVCPYAAAVIIAEDVVGEWEKEEEEEETAPTRDSTTAPTA